MSVSDGVTAPSFFPHQAAQPPEVTYEADEGSMWTLLLTNLGKGQGAHVDVCLPHLPGAALGSWGRGQVESSSPSSFQGRRREGAAVPEVSRVCLCVDGHLLEADAEYVHWLV